jgi:hypothetical protein
MCNRRCSSVGEQGFHKAKVAGSIPAIGTITELYFAVRMLYKVSSRSSLQGEYDYGAANFFGIAESPLE